MDTPRIALYGALIFVMFLLFQAFEKDYPTQVVAKEVMAQDLPHTAAQKPALSSDMVRGTASSVMARSAAPKQSSIQVETDVLHLRINLNQGEVEQASLLHYPVSLTDNQPVELLKTTKESQFVAKSQLVSEKDGQMATEDFGFETEKQHYTLDPNQDKLVVTLKGTSASGLQVEKIFTFTKGSYLVEVAYKLHNNGQSAWTGYLNTQLYQSSPTVPSSSLFQVGTYKGASYGAPGVHRYEKVTFQEMTKERLNQKATDGWIAMQEHYFLTAFIPAAKATQTFYTSAHDETYIIGTMGEAVTLEPQGTAQLATQLYIGPEITHVLSAIAPGLDLTVDYGWFWFISGILFSVMKWINHFIGNWGWTIIFITLLIKLAFYRLSASSYRSMAGMRQLQPKLTALRERFGEDKTKLSQATMELYRQEKINPFGGCLPIVVQIPVFIALYWVLIESVELRQAPFIFGIYDLAAPDTYHILPIIMGLTMLIQQKLNPAPPDPAQAKMMMLLPVVFTAIFWGMPSGLVLYWIVNNVLSILQQWWIVNRVEAQAVKGRDK